MFACNATSPIDDLLAYELPTKIDFAHMCCVADLVGASMFLQRLEKQEIRDMVASGHNGASIFGQCGDAYNDYFSIDGAMDFLSRDQLNQLVCNNDDNDNNGSSKQTAPHSRRKAGDRTDVEAPLALVVRTIKTAQMLTTEAMHSVSRYHSVGASPSMDPKFPCPSTRG